MKRSSRRAGVAGSVVLHLLFVTVAILSLPRKGPPPEPQEVQISLLPPLVTPPRRKPLTKPAAALVPFIAAATVRPAEQTVPSPIIVSQAPAPEPSAGEDQERAKLTALLRGSVGCSEAKLVRLSQAELDRCEKWRRAHVDPNLQLPLLIPAEKRAWYDATLAARHAPDHPPGFVCGMLLDGIHLVKPKTPPHALKLGALPCYVVPPKWGVTEDADVGALSKQDSAGKTLDYTPKTFLSNGKPGPGGPSGFPGD